MSFKLPLLVSSLANRFARRDRHCERCRDRHKDYAGQLDIPACGAGASVLVSTTSAIFQASPATTTTASRTNVTRAALWCKRTLGRLGTGLGRA